MGERVVDGLQRAAVLEAMVELVAERGYAQTSLALVLGRAGVSRRAFHEQFASLEECFMAVLDEGMERMATVMSQAFAGEGSWLDGLLAAEAAVLSCLDGEPQLARVLLVEALGVGSWVLKRRERNIAALRTSIVEHLKDAPPGASFPPMAAEGVMASVIGIMHDHLVRGESAPLVSLLGPLMGAITAPYLDPAGVAREVRRGDALSRRILAGRAPPSSNGNGKGNGGAGCELRVPRALSDPRAHRARSCVVFIAGSPGASNRQIADGIGVRGHSQISTLLARLQRAGLLHKRAGRQGDANAWRLTPLGEQAAALLGAEGSIGAEPDLAEPDLAEPDVAGPSSTLQIQMPSHIYVTS